MVFPLPEHVVVFVNRCRTVLLPRMIATHQTGLRVRSGIARCGNTNGGTEIEARHKVDIQITVATEYTVIMQRYDLISLSNRVVAAFHVFVVSTFGVGAVRIFYREYR